MIISHDFGIGLAEYGRRGIIMNFLYLMFVQTAKSSSLEVAFK